MEIFKIPSDELDKKDEQDDLYRGCHVSSSTLAWVGLRVYAGVVLKGKLTFDAHRQGLG